MDAARDPQFTQHPEPGVAWAQTYLEVSLALARDLPPVELLRALLRFAGPGFTSARLGLLDDITPTRARIIAEADGAAVRSADYPERISDYPGWDTLAEREVIIRNALTDPALSSEQRDRLRARRMGALMLAPLKTDNDVLGVLILSSPAPLELDQARMHALAALLSQAARGLAERQTRDALAFERDRNQRTARQLDAVARLALRAGTFPDSIALYDFAVRELVQLLDADHGGVLVLDPDEVAGTVVAEYPASGALGSRLTMAGNEIFDIVRAQRGAPVIVNHIADDHRLLPDTREVFEKLGLRSIMFIPVMQGERIIASIGMDLFTDEREFDSAILETAQAMAAQISSTLDNLRRSEQVTRQLRAVETMSSLATSIYRLQEDESALFDSIAEEVARTTESDHVVFVMLQPDGVHGVIASEYPPRGTAGVEIELGASVMAGALRQLQAGADGPVVLSNLQSDTRVPAEVTALFKQFDVHSMLFAPLIVDNRLTGMVAFDRSGVNRPYEPEIVTVAGTLGAELSVGLQNIRLVQEARRRAAQLERIAEFARDSQTSEQMEHVLDSAVESLRQIVPSDRIGVLLFDEAEGELRLVARYQDGAQAVHLADGPLVAVAGTYVGQVWTSQTALSITDSLEGAAGRARGDVGIRSMLLFPFNAGPALRGVISIGSAAPGRYNDSDAAVVQQMVNQFAAALESRATLAARQMAAEQQALINALSARYQRGVNVDDLLSATLREVGDHLGVRRARVRLALEPAPVARWHEEDQDVITGNDLW
jgi:GAF domain-containing protein